MKFQIPSTKFQTTIELLEFGAWNLEFFYAAERVYIKNKSTNNKPVTINTVVQNFLPSALFLASAFLFRFDCAMIIRIYSGFIASVY